MVVALGPTSPQSHGAPDELASIVVRRLQRRPRRGSWGLTRTVVLGVASFGVAPMLVWPVLFRKYARDEIEALGELAHWARLRGKSAGLVQLADATDDLAASWAPVALSGLAAVAIFALFAIHFAGAPLTLDALLRSTYGRPFFDHPVPEGTLYWAWVALLGAGYAVQIGAIVAHRRRVARFVERFNPIVTAELLPPIALKSSGRASHWPLWVLTAILLGVYNAWWGVPMVIAALAQRRYTRETSRHLRRELAYRVQDIVAERRIIPPDRCANPRCLAPVKPGARFCGRCGVVAGGAPRAAAPAEDLF